MKQNPFMYVANELKAINDKIKSTGSYSFMRDESLKSQLEDRVNNLIKYAEKHNVPIKISLESIIKKVKNTELGEVAEDESYEDSYYEDSF